MTKGNSVIHAVEAVRNEGYATARVVLVIDREVPHNYVKDRVKCFSIFNHSDFSRFIDDKLKEVH